MIEIKKIEGGLILDENQPLIRYMFNHTEVALIHFLEQLAMEGKLVSPLSLDDLVQQIVTVDDCSYCLWTEQEGYIAKRM